MTYITVSVDVDVELSEIRDEDLLEEVSARALGENFDLNLGRKLFDAFKLGKQEEAIAIARKIAELSTGGILT